MLMLLQYSLFFYGRDGLTEIVKLLREVFMADVHCRETHIKTFYCSSEAKRAIKIIFKIFYAYFECFRKNHQLCQCSSLRNWWQWIYLYAFKLLNKLQQVYQSSESIGSLYILAKIGISMWKATEKLGNSIHRFVFFSVSLRLQKSAVVVTLF